MLCDMIHSCESGSSLTSKTKLGTNCSICFFLLYGSEPWVQELETKNQQRQEGIFSNTSVKCGFTIKEKFVPRKGLDSLAFDFTALETATFAAQEWGQLTVYPKHRLARVGVLFSTSASLGMDKLICPLNHTFHIIVLLQKFLLLAKNS